MPITSAADPIDFIVCGAQKAGTTALHRALRKHRHIFTARKKELHFFDDDNVDWSRPNTSKLLDAFADAPSDTPRGEVTPIYMYWPNCFERINAVAPAARLIFILRDPRDRALSQYMMERNKGNDDVPFSLAIRSGRERVKLSQNGSHRVFSYIERGFYSKQLQRAQTIFSRDSILVLSFDHMVDDPDGTLTKIESFIEVDACPDAREQLSKRPDSMSSFKELPTEDQNELCELFAEEFDKLGTMEFSGVELRELVARWRLK